MTRIAVIGNSHVASLRNGWEQVGHRHDAIHLDFFAAPHPGFNELELGPGLRFGIPEGGVGARTARLIRTINGRDAIDLGEFDLVFWAGFRWPAMALAAVGGHFEIDGLGGGDAALVMSEPAFDAVLADLIDGMLPPSAWRGWSRPRLVCLSQASFCETCLADERAIFDPWRIAQRGDRVLPRVIETFFDRAARRFADCGIALLRQPATTLAPSGLTETCHRIGATRLVNGAPQPATDQAHMNAAFGGAYLDAALADLGLAAAPAEPLAQEA